MPINIAGLAKLGIICSFSELICRQWEVLSRCFRDVAIPLDLLIDLLDGLKASPRFEEVDIEEVSINRRGYLFLYFISAYLVLNVKFVWPRKSVSIKMSENLHKPQVSVD